jgi:ankyrin repeat protein
VLVTECALYWFSWRSHTILTPRFHRFLFASLYLGGIFRCKSVRTVRQELEFLNSTSTYPLGVTDHLEPLYSRMMQAVRSQLGHDRDHALTAILWLSHHSGDMDARFLSLVVSVPPLREDARELEEFDILDHDEILDCCCGLVNANGFGQYRLVHETFRDYLRRNPIVPRDEAGISMTKASLSCLCRSRYFVPHVNLRDLDPALHLLTTSVAGLPAEVAIKLERATEVEFNQFMRFDPYLLEAVVSYNLQPYDIPMPRRMSGNILSSPNISVTQLQLATLFHRYALVTHLLSQKPGDVDDGVPTPLVVACAMRDGQRMADILLNHGASLKANDTSFQGRTPLHWAVESKNISMTRLLLERGADVDAVDRLRGRTPLHCATHDTSLSIVDVLLAKHADVHVSSTYSKETPLHLACGAGHVQLVNRLLEHGASIKAQDFLGRTPLHVAAAAGHNEVLDRLLRDIRAGRDSKDAYHTSLLEAKNSLGQTPLIAHIKTNGNVSTARILLLNGADPNTCDKDGDTALHAACAAQFCADIPALLLCLLHYGASVSATDNQGRTPLHRVAQSPWIALDLVEEARIEALISNGADPSAVDAQKCTPLHYAAKNELHLQVLLSRGASANARDTLGRTALHWIALGYGTDQCDATDVDARIKTLLEHGANLEITDDSGYTPGDLVFQEWCNVAEQVPRSAPAAAQVLRVFCLRGAVFISLAGREKRIRGRVRHTPGSGRGKPRSASCEFRSIPPMKEGNSGEERRCESCPPRRNCHPELDQPDEKMLDEAIERLHAYKPVKAELAV